MATMKFSGCIDCNTSFEIKDMNLIEINAIKRFLKEIVSY